MQGERDPFGRRSEVAAYELSEAVQIRGVPDGDYAFKPCKASSRSERESWEETLAAVVGFIRSRPR